VVYRVAATPEPLSEAASVTVTAAVYQPVPHAAALHAIVVVGTVVSTVHVKLAGFPTLPTASVARTENVWLPSPSPLYPSGLVHAAYAPPSIAHSNVANASSEPNEKLADELALGFDGLAVIDAVGAELSTVHPKVAATLVLPA